MERRAAQLKRQLEEGVKEWLKSSKRGSTFSMCVSFLSHTADRLMGLSTKPSSVDELGHGQYSQLWHAALELQERLRERFDLSLL